MAIDSKAKRFAIAQNVFPQGAKGRSWRASVAKNYPVADFAAPVIIAAPTAYLLVKPTQQLLTPQGTVQYVVPTPDP